MLSTDIYKYQRICIVLSNTFSLSKTDHLGLEKKTSQIQNTGIMLCILLDLSEIKPTIGRKQISTKYTNAWRLNNS